MPAPVSLQSCWPQEPAQMGTGDMRLHVLQLIQALAELCPSSRPTSSGVPVRGWILPERGFKGTKVSLPNLPLCQVSVVLWKQLPTLVRALGVSLATCVNLAMPRPCSGPQISPLHDGRVGLVCLIIDPGRRGDTGSIPALMKLPVCFTAPCPVSSGILRFCDNKR